MLIITHDGEERHVHHSDRECAYCGEPSPFADYCSEDCHGKGEHQAECETCHELVACDHECAGRGDHQRTMYSLDCPGCERHPIAYRESRHSKWTGATWSVWSVLCEDCGLHSGARTLAAAIYSWRNPADPEEEARCAADHARDEARDRELEGVS